ncbi:hypothetical protein J4H86_05080 [Spiractinospora alimapuensis]|uniref:DUF6082 family protein n=1 Tax=Spiractinospora alimapuensis TaxID=2820884 RepID=UPI001F17C21A|nr:DUF6082 family protein [Spiractinospora alimapuensis]QVQ53163.1 hypothetical protein J4H86_05080 [Spiractinospora alimapuensis]
MVTLLVVLAVALVGLSPFTLVWFTGQAQDWEQLSLVGQTYGAASALLAGLALLGIAATLVLQLREVRNSREIALRESNSELLRMAMDDPAYRACWGTNFPADASTADRQRMYTNMIFSQWESAFESGAMGEAVIRAVARKVLAGRIGWEYWRDVREIRLSTSETRRARRFHRIIDDEFHALPEPRSERTAPVKTSPRAQSHWTTLAALGTSAAVSAATAWLWLRHRYGRS